MYNYKYDSLSKCDDGRNIYEIRSAPKTIHIDASNFTSLSEQEEEMLKKLKRSGITSVLFNSAKRIKWFCKILFLPLYYVLYVIPSKAWQILDNEVKRVVKLIGEGIDRIKSYLAPYIKALQEKFQKLRNKIHRILVRFFKFAYDMYYFIKKILYRTIGQPIETWILKWVARFKYVGNLIKSPIKKLYLNLQNRAIKYQNSSHALLHSLQPSEAFSQQVKQLSLKPGILFHEKANRIGKQFHFFFKVIRILFRSISKEIKN